jgi:hypothetical protein
MNHDADQKCVIGVNVPERRGGCDASNPLLVACSGLTKNILRRARKKRPGNLPGLLPKRF